MTKESISLLLFVITLAVILAATIFILRLNDYYTARELGAKMFCVEQKAKHKFCEKYFNGRDHMSDGRPWPFNK